jgi:hypothetical protein
MSYKGPSLVITAGKPAALTIDRSGDAPGRSDRFLRPRRPHHLASAAPLPASWAATVRVLVFGGSRSPRRECVGRVLWPGHRVPQGVCGPFLDILRVPASRPQEPPRFSTDIASWSTGNRYTCGLGDVGAAGVIRPVSARSGRAAPAAAPVAGRAGGRGVDAVWMRFRGRGNRRRALIGMSYKGPSAGEHLGQARGPLLDRYW